MSAFQTIATGCCPFAAAEPSFCSRRHARDPDLPERSLRIGRDFFIEPYETLELVAQHHNDSVEDQQLDAEDDQVDSVITDLEQAKQARAQREQLEADIAAQLKQDGPSDSQGGESGHGGVA